MADLASGINLSRKPENERLNLLLYILYNNNNGFRIKIDNTQGMVNT